MFYPEIEVSVVGREDAGEADGRDGSNSVRKF
jgi:hypothetical protein